MMHRFNKQNLKNTKLYAQIFRIEGISPSWSEPYLIDKANEMLNDQEFRLAPRRHKATPIEQPKNDDSQPS